MKTFRYTGENLSGVVGGSITAPSQKQAKAELRKNGVKPTRISRETTSSPKAFWALLSLLKVLLEQKISLSDALVISSQQSNKHLAGLSNNILVHLNEGADLHSILKAKFPDIDSTTLNLLQIGASTAGLGIAIDILLKERSLKKKLEQDIIKAVAYPAFVLLFSIIALIVVFDSVLPEFSQIIDKNNQTFVQGLILSGAGKGYSTFLLIFWSSIVLILSGMAVSRIALIRTWICDCLDQTPGLRSLFRKRSVEKFIGALSLGLSLKADLALSVELAISSVSNSTHHKRLRKTNALLLNGVTFSRAMKETAIFDPMFIAQIEVGERTSTLSQTMQNIHSSLMEAKQHKAAIVSQIVGPFAIIVLGIIIFLVAYIIITPMMSLQNSIG